MGVAMLGSRCSPRWMIVVLSASSILFVAFVSQLPIGLFADAGFDDAWFWLRAESIAQGHWLGAYDQMTLAKGSGYPLFLAVVHYSGLSVITAQALLYCGACLLLGAGVQRMTHRPWLAVVLVLAIQWHPTALVWTRLLRDYLGAAQLLAGVGCALLFLCAPDARRRGWRWAVLAGLLIGWAWTTREDLVWSVPGLALLLLVRAGPAWREAVERRRLAIGLGLFALSFAGWISLVAGVNLAKYGSFATVETRGWDYADALWALQRVRVGEATPYVPVPARVREAVYAVSPAFAQLRPQLETGDASHWKGVGCPRLPESCGDFAGGWFMWALRDAVAANGGHASAPKAGAFYRQIADEIGQACASGRLTCVDRIRGLLPPTTSTQWLTLPPRLHSAAAKLLWQGVGGSGASGVGTLSSSGDPAAVRAMWVFVGQPKLPDSAADLQRFGIPPTAEAPMALRWLKHGIGLGYRAVLPWLSAAGIVAFGWSLAKRLRRRQPDALLALAASAWCLVAGRAGFLALVDMTSFPAIHAHYLQPAFPLVVVAAIASLATLIRPARHVMDEAVRNADRDAIA